MIEHIIRDTRTECVGWVYNETDPYQCMSDNGDGTYKGTELDKQDNLLASVEAIMFVTGVSPVGVFLVEDGYTYEDGEKDQIETQVMTVPA